MNKDIMKRDIEYLKDMDRYIEKVKKETFSDSFNALERIGLLDENGNIVAPYNGENVNCNDFTRGPKRIRTLKCKR